MAKKKDKPEESADYLHWLAENTQRGALKRLNTPVANPGQQPRHRWHSFQQN